MDIDYAFCREAKLTTLDLLVWLGFGDDIDNDNCYIDNWKFFGRCLSIHDNSLRISTLEEDFDKWSSSTEYWFDFNDDYQKGQFIDFVICEREKLK